MRSSPPPPATTAVGHMSESYQDPRGPMSPWAAGTARRRHGLAPPPLSPSPKPSARREVLPWSSRPPYTISPRDKGLWLKISTPPSDPHRRRARSLTPPRPQRSKETEVSETPLQFVSPIRRLSSMQRSVTVEKERLASSALTSMSSQPSPKPSQSKPEAKANSPTVGFVQPPLLRREVERQPDDASLDGLTTSLAAEDSVGRTVEDPISSSLSPPHPRRASKPVRLPELVTLRRSSRGEPSVTAPPPPLRRGSLLVSEAPSPATSRSEAEHHLSICKSNALPDAAGIRQSARRMEAVAASYAVALRRVEDQEAASRRRELIEAEERAFHRLQTQHKLAAARLFSAIAMGEHAVMARLRESTGNSAAASSEWSAVMRKLAEVERWTRAQIEVDWWSECYLYLQPSHELQLSAALQKAALWDEQSAAFGHIMRAYRSFLVDVVDAAGSARRLAHARIDRFQAERRRMASLESAARDEILTEERTARTALHSMAPRGEGNTPLQTCGASLPNANEVVGGGQSMSTSVRSPAAVTALDLSVLSDAIEEALNVDPIVQLQVEEIARRRSLETTESSARCVLQRWEQDRSEELAVIARHLDWVASDECAARERLGMSERNQWYLLLRTAQAGISERPPQLQLEPTPVAVNGPPRTPAAWVQENNASSAVSRIAMDLFGAADRSFDSPDVLRSLAKRSEYRDTSTATDVDLTQVHRHHAVTQTAAVGESKVSVAISAASPPSRTGAAAAAHRSVSPATGPSLSPPSARESSRSPVWLPSGKAPDHLLSHTPPLPLGISGGGSSQLVKTYIAQMQGCSSSRSGSPPYSTPPREQQPAAVEETRRASSRGGAVAQRAKGGGRKRGLKPVSPTRRSSASERLLKFKEMCSRQAQPQPIMKGAETPRPAVAASGPAVARRRVEDDALNIPSRRIVDPQLVRRFPETLRRREEEVPPRLGRPPPVRTGTRGDPFAKPTPQYAHASLLNVSYSSTSVSAASQPVAAVRSPHGDACVNEPPQLCSTSRPKTVVMVTPSSGGETSVSHSGPRSAEWPRSPEALQHFATPPTALRRRAVRSLLGGESSPRDGATSAADAAVERLEWNQFCEHERLCHAERAAREALWRAIQDHHQKLLMRRAATDATAAAAPISVPSAAAASSAQRWTARLLRMYDVPRRRTHVVAD